MSALTLVVTLFVWISTICRLLPYFFSVGILTYSMPEQSKTSTGKLPKTPMDPFEVSEYCETKTVRRKVLTPPYAWNFLITEVFRNTKESMCHFLPPTDNFPANSLWYSTRVFPNFHFWQLGALFERFQLVLLNVGLINDTPLITDSHEFNTKI